MFWSPEIYFGCLFPGLNTNASASIATAQSLQTACIIYRSPLVLLFKTQQMLGPGLLMGISLKDRKRWDDSRSVSWVEISRTCLVDGS